jgi:hypothetical protein
MKNVLHINVGVQVFVNQFLVAANARNVIIFFFVLLHFVGVEIGVHTFGNQLCAGVRAFPNHVHHIRFKKDARLGFVTISAVFVFLFAVKFVGQPFLTEK